MSLYTENEDCDFAILHVISDSLDGFLKQVDTIMKLSESEAIETAMLRELMDATLRRYSELLCKETHRLKEREGQ